ncbi:hypothetical protein Cni_G03070 [Canna indica]|uniref:Receptor ligand binding region domain-containing protein n=1 Tax=Canna indica TaxID=4628 RepID=A0AAQ3JQI7_9LILI|nr:hypothetical protein Cni_G03070 [Canna indica]
MIPPHATNDRILAELEKINKTRTRVFVVHMPYYLAFQLFSVANDAGMMKKGYVWITTYGLTDIVDLMGSPAAKVMQGVVGIKPYVQSKKLDELKVRWRKKYHQENTNAKLYEPTIFGLWAYDTIWSLAMAAERLQPPSSSFIESNNRRNNSTDLGRLVLSKRGPKLRELILNTTFNGTSGEFKLVEGQVLKSESFEIINVVGNGNRRVGYWPPQHNISSQMNITWPGGSTTMPKGWQWPTERNELLIGIPVKPGFKQFVRNDSHPDGYCIQVFEAVMRELPYNVTVKYEVFADHHGESNGTYDDLLYKVYLGVSYFLSLS